MKLRIVSILLTLTLALLSPALIIPMRVNAPTQYGPRSQELQIIYYTDETQLYAALTAGEIEINTWDLTTAQANDAKTRPEVMLAKVERLGMRSHSINNNLTIATYSGVLSHMSDVNFRKAIAHLIDKDYYVDVINDGAAIRTDTHVASPAKDWWNWTLVNGVHPNGTVFTNYPYPFNTLQANYELNQTGYVYGADDNPYYDPLTPGSARKWRVYPAGHPQKANQKLDGLVFYSRSDDTIRLLAGNHFRDYLLKSGIPVDYRAVSFAVANENVMLARNYHIYTGGWSLGRYPLALYSWFHSVFWYSGGPNYHASVANGYTDVDYWGDQFNTAPNLTYAIYSAQRIQSLVIEKYAIAFSLWNTIGWYGYRNLQGIVNYFAVGPENGYTYLNSYRLDDATKPIRVGIKGFPNQLNQMYSRWVWETSTFAPYMASFMSANPFEIFRDQPWLAKDWIDGTWVDTEDGDKIKSKITYWFRNTAEWIEPITGTPLATVDANFYPFSLWYYYQTPDAWIWSGYKDVHHVRLDPDNTGDNYKVEVYHDVRSMFAVLNPWGRDLYPPAWKRAPLSSLETKVFVEGVNATTPGNLPLPFRTIGAPVEIVEVKDEGTTLTRYTDYDMIKGRIKILKDITEGNKITVTYWARGDASGYNPGGVAWNTIHIGYGPYYMYEHQPGAGGWSSFKANRNFFLETPPLAELDWFYYFAPGDKPRTGSYKVDIYDVVKTTSAYGSTGHLVPSINWEPTADIKPGPIPPLTGDRAGKIDVYDLSSVQGQYGVTFGTP